MRVRLFYRKRRLGAPSALLISAVLAAAACADVPNLKKQKAVATAEQYFVSGRMNEAPIELCRALQIRQRLLASREKIHEVLRDVWWLRRA
jgi:predicted Zn-dependent protease